ncbi:MAG: hypothetical protein EOP33_06765 [Rickettsiaceae bacterium]|nr:MAG: hypothetical protein EOP33_06765 [Rickettsiaceae bacterium]
MQFIKSARCFLDHLSLVPVERHDRPQRKLERQNGIVGLSERLKIYQPETVIILMKALEKQVQQSIDLLEIQSNQHQTTFFYPAGSNTNYLACVRGLVSILKITVDAVLSP